MTNQLEADRWTHVAKVQQVMVNDPAVNRAPVELYGITDANQSQITFLCFEGDPAESHIRYWTPSGQPAQYVAHIYLAEDDLRRHGDRLVSAAACTVTVTYELGKTMPTGREKDALHAFRIGYVREI